MKTKFTIPVVLFLLTSLASFSQVTHTEQKGMGCNDKFRLDIINASGLSKQMLVGYIEDATLGYDRLYDGKFFGSSPVMLYSFVNDDINDIKLVIQGRSFPTVLKEVVPIGIEIASGLSDMNKIQLATCEGVIHGADILLVDKVACITHNLAKGPYEFTAAPGVYNDRFEIVLDGNIFSTLSNDAFENDKAMVHVNEKDKVFTISSTKFKIEEITIFSLCGQLIHSEKYNSLKNEIKIESIQPTSNILIVNIILSNGEKVTKRVLY